MPYTEPPIPKIPNNNALTQVRLALDNEVPLVLFPVRLETRFLPIANGGTNLCVRVYPDKVHIDTHESALTEQEIFWGKRYWEEVSVQSADEKVQLEAWRQLAERFDPPRAAWIAKQLAPNPGGAFPTTDTKLEAWTQSPKVRLLPKQWWVLGYTGDRWTLASGKPIDPDLAAGPDPKFFDTVEGELQVDPGMKWMVDFVEAEKKGMGIRLEVKPEHARGFDFLLVFGTNVEVDVQDQARLLGKLLESQYYTGGLSFIPPGLPTNNTPDAPSGFDSSPDAQGAAYLASIKETDSDIDIKSNAKVISTALGLPVKGSVLARARGAKGREQLDAFHMNRAVWPSTWSYFLRQMMGVKKPPNVNIPVSSTLGLSDIEWGRQHFINYVRPFGPQPSFRIGKQPYGLLPVTSLDVWKPKSDDPHASKNVSLQKFLLKAREVWRRSLPNVPTIMSQAQPNQTSEQNIKQIFSADGISSHYSTHHLIGGYFYLTRLWKLFRGNENFTDQNIKIWPLVLSDQTRPILDQLELLGLPLMSFSAFSGWSTHLTKPLVTPNVAADIDLLLSAVTFDELSTDISPERNCLLRTVLCHGMRLEIWMAAIDLLYSSGNASTYWLKFQEPELVDIDPVQPHTLRFTAPRQELNNPVSGITQDRIGDYLVKLRKGQPNVPDHATRVLEFRESLEHLKTLTPSQLQQLFAGTLDLCSHRLDAWITSFATKRLEEMRSKRPTGVTVGGYGWVMNLRPDPPPIPDTPLPGETESIFRLRDNAGYTQAPSLAQASTAAILRSGQLTHSESETGNPLAIDLTSERVRWAQWLLDGVRQGQPLGALLGYRFERGLQDTRMGFYIPFFRHVAPLVANKLQETASTSDIAVESLAANNVVDGLVLQRKWKEALEVAPPGEWNQLWHLFGLRKPDPHDLYNHRLTLTSLLTSLDNGIDAVSDALLAETVHQAVQGNPQRTASTLSAIATGEAPPPELEVVRTPRTGTALTHRIVALFNANPELPAGWAVSDRANAEPSLNTWVARLLGSPTVVRCIVERRDPSTNQVLPNEEVFLSELGLAPLDLIYAAESSRDAQPAEIEQRIFHHLRKKDPADNAIFSVDPRRGTTWSSTDLSYGEFSELLRTARRLITGARAIDGGDLALPENNQTAGVVLSELQSRVKNAADALDTTISNLNGVLANAANAELVDIKGAILRAAQYGIQGAVPDSSRGDSEADRDTLVSHLTLIAEELAKRNARLTAMAPDPNSETQPADPVKNEIARLRIIFGDSFLVLPQFTADNASELDQALKNSRSIQNRDTLAVVKVFQRASRVREGVSRLDASLRYAEALKTGEQLNLRVAQLPLRDDDRWVGLPLKQERPTLSPSRFSLIVQSDKTVKVTEPLTGLLIDEWVEVVPNSSETTGVAFHYDQPNTEPPQSILVAVHPDSSEPWNIWYLQQVLLETLDLARIRAVDPEALEAVGHYLPAMYFAVNDGGDAISTDLTKLK